MHKCTIADEVCWPTCEGQQLLIIVVTFSFDVCKVANTIVLTLWVIKNVLWQNSNEICITVLKPLLLLQIMYSMTNYRSSKANLIYVDTGKMPANPGQLPAKYFSYMYS